MKVRISDTYTNQEIISYSIMLGSGSANQHLLDQDYFEEAWKNAIEDNLVDKDRRSEYKFEIVIK
ncbi:hypothetical protein [Nitrosomonas sp. Nm166]|uniref:hypothetical protein n=1 Tax=Nitrosomonas sp. Nm166 TaxID=1881054 RepID=UPI0008E922C7|nr:hypothetical protein [Nitrosomonas sp. Nm166]SFF16646.1 hypothetical protein SAMN05428977_10618 [Nitrosomonas sp. Nm166]